MDTKIKGFHVCKAGNAPSVGQVKSFVVNGDRIKSAFPDKGGLPYKIVSAIQRESYKDNYQNLGFDLEIEPQNGAQSTQAPAQRANGGGWGEDRSNRIERQHSQEMALRYCALTDERSQLKTSELRELIDWFQRDVGRSPERKSEPTEPDSEPQPQPSEEEQF